MNSTMGLFVAGLVFSVWGLFRALTTGEITGDESEYSMVAQPIRFWISFVFELGLLMFCAAGVAHGMGLCGDPGTAVMALLASGAH